MVNQVNRVLEELGWSDGFHVPVADEANKALEAEIEAKMKRKLELTSEMESLTDHLGSMAKHSHSLEQEHKENQALVAEFRNHIQSLDSQYRLTVAEKAKIEQEIRQAEKLCRDMEERNTIHEMDARRRTERVEEYKRGLRWDKDALLAWEEEVARNDGDNTMLMKYMAEDDSKAKSLELRRQQLTSEEGKSRSQLNRMLDDLMSREQQLEKTAVLYRAGVKARREHIDQWERTVQVLRQRDADIKQTRDEMNLIRSVMRGLSEQLAEQKDFASSQRDDNRSVASATEAHVRQAQWAREKMLRLERETETARCEAGAIRRQLADTARRTEQGRANVVRLAKDAKSLNKRRGVVEVEVVELKKQREDIKDRTMSAAERAKHYQDTLDAEEKRKATLGTDMHRLQNGAYRWRKRLADAKEHGERLAMQISALEGNSRQAKAKQRDVLAEIKRQEEFIHTLEYKACCLQSRIDRLTGEGKSEEDMELVEARANQLEATLAEKTATANMLTSQLMRLEEDMRHLSTFLAGDQSELLLLTSKRQAAMLLVDGSEKRLRLETAANQRRRAEESVLRLRVSQKERGMQRAGGRVYSLERQRLELEAAMRERELELASRTAVLKQKKRALLEERGKLAAEIAERRVKTEQLDKRHEIAEGLLGKDEDGEQLTVTAFKIKTLQDKLLLQEQGDELDGKIRRAEKEILAMENTLKVVNCSNDAYKRSLACVGADDPEYQEKLDLEAEYFESLDRLRLRKSQLAQLALETQNLQRDMEAAMSADEEAAAEVLNKQQAVAEAERELNEQVGRLERAGVQLSRLQKAVRSGTKSHTLEERDVETRDVAQQNLCALQRLAELVAQHPEAAPVVTRHLHDKQLSLPQALRRPQSASVSEVSERLTPSVVNVEPVWPSEGMPTAEVCGSAAALARRPTPVKSAPKVGKKSR